LPSGQVFREYELVAVEREIEVVPGVFYPAWTYNGQVPGPTLRCTEGDRIRVQLTNATEHPHSIHFHGTHPAEMDGAFEPIPPGGRFSFIHNTTEGLGIVAPLATERPRLGQLVALGALAGMPTVIGTWIGGFTVSPIWTTLFFAVGAGAIGQVVAELLRLLLRGPGARVLTPLNSAGLLAGLLLMYGTGLLSAA